MKATVNSVDLIAILFLRYSYVSGTLLLRAKTASAGCVAVYYSCHYVTVGARLRFYCQLEGKFIKRLFDLKSLFPKWIALLFQFGISLTQDKKPTSRKYRFTRVEIQQHMLCDR